VKNLPLLKLAREYPAPEIDLVLAHLFFNGLGVPKDEARAVKLLRQAAECGQGAAMWLLGEFLLDSSHETETAEGLQWLERAANRGVGMAALRLAIFFGNRDSKHFNDGMRLQWTSRAADMGVPLAAYQLGVAFENGEIGQRPDHALAVHWYEVAAMKDLPLAFDRLAEAVRNGEMGLAKSDVRADELTRKASDSRQIKQRLELEDWLVLAKADDRDAQKLLSFAYREGLAGLPPDLEQAKYWEGRARQDP
jgi:TPR repeat protein